MFHSKTLGNKINKIHERALRIVCKNNALSFDQLLEMDKSFIVHEWNLQKLAIGMYKVKNGLCPKPFSDIFTLRNDGQGFILPLGLGDPKHGTWYLKR